MSDLLSIHKMAVDKAIKILDASGALYAVQYNGETYGTLEVKPHNPNKRNKPYAHGETRSHYLPYIENLQIGQSVSVPFSYFDGRILASNISACCISLWGNGAAMTAKNEETKSIEVLRLA